MEERNLIKGLLLLLLSCAFVTVAPVFAQGGGKAEPLRIEFRRGAKSATVKGKVRRDEQAEFAFTARQGQQVSILLSSKPIRSARFELTGPGEDSQLKYNGYNWSGTAPLTGDYLIYVSKPGGINSSSFSLTLIIK